MEIIINKLLFFTLFIFNMETPFINNEAELTIDLIKQEVTIKYTDIYFPEKYSTEADNFENIIKSKTIYYHDGLEIKIKSAKAQKSHDKVSLTVKGVFNDKDELLKELYFRKNEQQIFYWVLSEEALDRSNGKMDKEGKLTWPLNANKIHLKLKWAEDTLWQKGFEEENGKLIKLK